jgi:ATP-binding cassette subfamily B protein
LGFISSYWWRSPWLVSGAAALMLASVGCELLVPLVSRRLIDVVALGLAHARSAFWTLCLFGLTHLGAVALRNGGLRFWMPLQARTMRDILIDGFKQVQTFSSEWHGERLSGATARQLSRGMSAADSIGDAVVLAAAPACLVLLGLSVMFFLESHLMGLFCLVMIVAYIASNILYMHAYVRSSRLLSAGLDSKLSGAVSDALACNPTVKSFAAETREEKRIVTLAHEWQEALLLTWRRSTDGWLLHDVLLCLLQVGLTGLVVLRWHAGVASAGDVAFAIASFLVMKGYLRNMGDLIRMAQGALTDMEEVARNARTAAQVTDQMGAYPIVCGPGEIRFENVTFRYSAAAKPIYKDFSLHIAPRERLAIVGPTGSGKSTLVKLIQRLYDVQGGRIVLDGQDIARVSQESLRRSIAVVPQDPLLFHRTIAENIVYARPDASQEEVIDAARRARAHDFIQALPDGYDTLVGDRGVKLSGGERQRIAIARAFLSDARVLILDEATSSLDTETEAKVQSAAEELMAYRTTIVIAHRLSTIRNVDRIIVLQEGHIVEDGAHGELMALDGVFARLLAAGQQTDLHSHRAVCLAESP